jgi:hypothetical protein
MPLEKQDKQIQAAAVVAQYEELTRQQTTKMVVQVVQESL